MMRALWTAASGMNTQQTNVDTIANNMSNINTTGFKGETAEFKTLLYQTIQNKSFNNNGTEQPVGIQVGLGVKTAAITADFTQGNFNETGNKWDFAINGNGFFQVQIEDGTIAYTRNGSLKMSIGVSGSTLCDSDGHPVLDVNGAPIVVDSTLDTSKIVVDENGQFTYPDANNNYQQMGIQIGLVQFNNPAGLNKIGGTMYQETGASGTPRPEAQDATLKKSQLKGQFLEAANVQAVDAMVDLIVAQRAYEMNSKVITTSDTMLQQANNLRG